MPKLPAVAPLLVLLLAAACRENSSAPAPAPAASTATTSVTPAPAALTRDEFNQSALRMNLPLYWMNDANHDGAPQPDEIAALLFYPSQPRWVEGGRFTKAFDDAVARLKAPISVPSDLSPEEKKRRQLVELDLEQGRPTLVYTDLRSAPEADKALTRHMLAVSKIIDELYATMKGMTAIASRVPADDPESQSLFRRNWGPKCFAPKTEKDPACSAIPGAPSTSCDAYPAALQVDPKFCDKLEKLPNAKALLDHFAVVREGKDGALAPVSYAEAYKPQMQAVAEELHAATMEITDPSEAALKAYLDAAATAFSTNDWGAADEAWSKMNAQNSKWYARIAPDEVYWEPCNHKAGFHTTFARINKDSLRWQEKLAPVEEEMESALAALIGPPYVARNVTFHLPDFIDIITNAGDDRAPMGATIGESLPNWGKVVAEGRGRTVAMSNLYADTDSMAARRKQAESLFGAETMKAFADSAEPELVSTILHEATHNLGPAHEYAVKGKTDDQVFGGGLASMLEELKAQSGALYYVEFLQKKGIISADLARQSYAAAVVWCFGHISRGMVTSQGERKPYSQLSAIQIGFLMDDGAIRFDPNSPAANGVDKGAFTIDFDKLPASVDKLMKAVGTIKATGDRARALELAAKYVDGPTVPQSIITERELRSPKATFVYAVDM
jgi:hypothetical protein